MRRVLIAGIAIGVALAALLALDLAQQGAVWGALWNLTGEEAPLAQVRGLVEYLGNFTRQQPQLDTSTRPAHADVNPYGVNTFLQQEVEPAKRERQVQMIAEAGFHWLRQEFPWEDIEIHGRGDFVDRRNDLDGDGQPDPVNAWAKYDDIVDLAAQYGLEILARLSNPPSWSRAAGDAGGPFAPPDDFADFARYAAAVAARYQGRLRYFQVWNEPNIYPEWGEQAVDPEAYTELLCAAYAALKAVDPEIVVVSGALAPTVALDRRDLNDFIFLQRMYDAGAGACFDVLSMQGYGLNSGPTDQRMRPTTVNYGRSQYVREIMVNNGDADKAIWLSEMNWNAAPEGMPDPYGRVTLEQQARWAPLAYARAREAWPWVGVISFWFFKPASDADREQPYYYFRMVEPDFTPLPVYDAMRAYITDHPY
ncbi:MAG: cellulase family glycosylhydrolase [Anaerolineae bacterium]|nr:cellulase family glycosylhydrolase [Anaerolineae bacterium]